MATERIDINPDLLRWAREGLGLDRETLANASQVSAERVREWEEGEGRPTYRQLEKTASKLLRDPSFFVGDEIPDEEPPRASFRRRFRASDRTPSYELLRELQVVLSRREEYLELRRELGQPVHRFKRVRKLRSPATMADRLREKLDVAIEEQASRDTVYQSLRLWTDAVEYTGVLVFQASRISVDEFRGLAIDGDTPFILLNGGDSPEARTFTLLHEYVHLCLGEDDFAQQPLTGPIETVSASTEQYCNAVAAELLMPVELIERAGVTDEIEGLSEIRRVARKLNVSSFALAVRLNQLGLAPGEVIGAMRRAAERNKTGGGSPGGNWYRTQARNLGRRYATTVMDALYTGRITQPTASALLGTPHSEGIQKLHEVLSGVVRER